MYIDERLVDQSQYPPFYPNMPNMFSTSTLLLTASNSQQTPTNNHTTNSHIATPFSPSASPELVPEQTYTNDSISEEVFAEQTCTNDSISSVISSSFSVLEDCDQSDIIGDKKSPESYISSSCQSCFAKSTEIKYLKTEVRDLKRKLDDGKTLRGWGWVALGKLYARNLRIPKYLESWNISFSRFLLS